MLRTGSPAPANAAIARNVRAHEAVASTCEASHPEIFNSVEQARLPIAVRDVLAACARATDAGGTLRYVRDYLLFDGRYDLAAGERCEDRETDCRMRVGRKQ